MIGPSASSPGLVVLVALATALSAQTLPPATSAPRVDVAARALHAGEVVVVKISNWTAPTSPRVSIFGRTAPAFQTTDGWQALIGVDLDVVPGVYTVNVRAADSLVATVPLRLSEKAFPTRRLTVDPRFVNPPASAAARIATEARELAAIWAASTAERLWDDAFVAPVPDEANSAFGTRSVFNGQARSPHSGADFASPTGRPVVAPNGGRVVLARDLYYTGQTVVIDHGLGLLSLFAHLSAIDTAEGARLSRGDAVGRVGATGRVTGPHLHWTVRLGGARVDPLSLISVTTRLD